MPIFRARHAIFSVCLLAVMGSTIMLRAQEEARPEEVIPIGPGYITKGYKTMVNGEVVRTTDGRDLVPSQVVTSPIESVPQPAPAAGNWPQVVTIINGTVVDPETKQPVNNLPAEVELIPLGLRKLSTDTIGPDGTVTTSETLVPYFRVVEKNAPIAPASPKVPSDGPDFSALLEAGETEEASTENPTDEKGTEKDSGGGFFDFLFGSNEPEDGMIELDLNRPLTQEEIEALQRNPQFQEYQRKRSNTNRNFYSSKGRSTVRNETPELPSKITVEEFKPEEWIDESPIPPTPNIAIGKLVSVDLNRQIAVCWLQTRYIQPNRPMVTRNYELQTTGVLIPAGQQDGRAVGFWIAEGSPSTGDEVILPGPDYENVVNPWIKKR